MIDTAMSAQGDSGLWCDDLERDAVSHWIGPCSAVTTDRETIVGRLRDLSAPLYVLRVGDRLGVSCEGAPAPGRDRAAEGLPLVAMAYPATPARLGDAGFRRTYGVRLAYMAGSMANGIASEDLVIALGRGGMLGSFGAAGLVPQRIEAAIDRLQRALPDGRFACNLIHSPAEEAIERATVELYLRRGVRTVEASAFLDLTPHVVRYRVAGLALDPHGGIVARNRVIAKVSRREVADKFLSAAPAPLLSALREQGLISDLQARLAERVPLCDDLTVEADSGGHTDNRPLVCLLPALLRARDAIQERHGYARPVRVGAAGGIGTPEAALAAFSMGAAYVVTGSVNQSCREAGASAHTKSLLAQADTADVAMAPAADMFELGIRVQVLKRGTFFPQRAQRLYDLYKAYDSLESMPAAERDRLERQWFRRSLEEVWQETLAFFNARDPEQIARAAGNPKRKMALVFRWYLGLSSRWSNAGEPGREMDYQVWCGPAMGAFNAWVCGTHLEAPAARGVVEVGEAIMAGAAYLARVHTLRSQGVDLAPDLARYAVRGAESARCSSL